MTPGGRWCPWCQRWAIACADPAGHGAWWFTSTPPPRQRSVVGTTLVATFTVLVIFPALVVIAIMALARLGSLG